MTTIVRPLGTLHCGICDCPVVTADAFEICPRCAEPTCQGCLVGRVCRDCHEDRRARGWQ